MKQLFIFIVLSLFTCLSFAQTRNLKLVPTENPVVNQMRKAVVIGMSAYGGANTLDNTLNDANDMADVLRKLGFEVTLLENDDLQTLRAKLADWYNSIEGNDMAVFYYAGHGMSDNRGRNYLIPIGANLLSEADLPTYTLSIVNVLDNMDAKNVKMKLLILDACRSNEFARSWTRGGENKGLGAVSAEGTYIAFATAPNSTAQDGGNYGFHNGVFTNYLKQEIVKPGLTISNVFDNVAKNVSKCTNKQQVPFRNNGLSDDFYFIPGNNPTPDYPTPVPYNPPAPTPSSHHPAEPEMILVQGGTFWMGCSGEQGSDCDSGESPLHSVTVSSFYIGKYEVTQKQWQLIMGNNPSNFKGDNLPVEDVSWNDTQEFIRRLNEATGKQYRLTTEAEWEYAARGGNKSQGYKYSGGNLLNDVAWYTDNSGSATHPVGTKRSNELGIYDMSGNVWEWCQDWYGTYPSSPQRDPMGSLSGSDRVFRGGGWNYGAGNCRVSRRGDSSPGNRSDLLGFRVACSSN